MMDYTNVTNENETKDEGTVEMIVEEITDVVNEEIPTDLPEVVDVIELLQKDEVEEVTEVIEPEDPIKPAVVSGCAKLNVRKEASKESDIVCVITPDSDLTVDVSKSTEEFYKVYTSVNEVLYEGYCVKKFIVIK